MNSWMDCPEIDRPIPGLDNYPSVVPPEEELPDDEEHTGYDDDDDGHYLSLIHISEPTRPY